MVVAGCIFLPSSRDPSNAAGRPFRTFTASSSTATLEVDEVQVSPEIPRPSEAPAGRAPIDWRASGRSCAAGVLRCWCWSSAGARSRSSSASALYLVRMFGITAFYHRYFSHRTFRTGRVMQFVGAVLGAAATQRGPLWWAAHHRQHHRHSDTDQDAHSPHAHGFWWSHIGWIA
jgi:hypothetical protein